MESVGIKGFPAPHFFHMFLHYVATVGTTQFLHYDGDNMVSKRIERSDFISAIELYGPEIARSDFSGFVGHFFKDAPEWKGDVKRLNRKLATEDNLQKRNQDLLTHNLELKRRIQLLNEVNAAQQSIDKISTDQIVVMRQAIEIQQTMIAELSARLSELGGLPEGVSGVATTVFINGSSMVIPSKGLKPLIPYVDFPGT